jgi:fumarylacetoacetate (FAA) hydrolase family protein
MSLNYSSYSPKNYMDASLIGRVWRRDISGPSVILVKNGRVIDITSYKATVSDLFEVHSLLSELAEVQGEDLCSLNELLEMSSLPYESAPYHLLAPCDLQAIKACGVTFADSMLERIIEEKAEGDAVKAAEIRYSVTSAVGDSLGNIVPGSAASEELKKVLQSKNMWSQYLEVGIGPYAEVFTKSQPLSAIGHGGDIGIHPESKWNNPEPEIVLAVNSKGKTVGATLGNDVNLRDFEGRSALLLGKAKDNNASCAIGPFVRLFDENYSMDDVRLSEIYLEVTGVDGFSMKGRSSMNQISRDPLNLVEQTIGVNHQYPDGLMLFLGTLFAPTEDRHETGSGFTHDINDVVTISNSKLGELTNKVNYTNSCQPWEFGISALMKNLSQRNLI